jgi:hypothetical protein
VFFYLLFLHGGKGSSHHRLCFRQDLSCTRTLLPVVLLMDSISTVNDHSPNAPVREKTICDQHCSQYRNHAVRCSGFGRVCF